MGELDALEAIVSVRVEDLNSFEHHHSARWILTGSTSNAPLTVRGATSAPMRAMPVGAVA